MSRVIKFRAWDGKQLVYFPRFWFCNEYSSVAFQTKEGGICGLSDMEFDEENAILEQFTGLLDKNGKEIYEGDFVKDAQYGYKVIWDDKYACFSMVGSDYDPTKHESFKIPKNIEVIGNIHENPELLEP